MTLKRFRNMNMFRFQSHWFVSSTCANLKQNLGARGCDVLPSMTCCYWTWEKELLAEMSHVNVLFYYSSARSIKDVTCNVSFTGSTEILNWNYRRGFPKFFWLKLIELIWKTMNGSLEWTFPLPILFLLYVVLLLLVHVIIITELVPSLDREIPLDSKTNPSRNSGNTTVIVTYLLIFFDICFVKEIKKKNASKKIKHSNLHLKRKWEKRNDLNVINLPACTVVTRWHALSLDIVTKEIYSDLPLSTQQTPLVLPLMIMLDRKYDEVSYLFQNKRPAKAPTNICRYTFFVFPRHWQCYDEP